MSNNNDNEAKFNLSFCGCGFLGIYHVGVATAFLEYAPQLSSHKISGSSAGALVAVAHICGNLQLAYAITDFLSVAIDARSRVLGPFHPSFDVNSNVREALERGLPENVHEMAKNRLHVSLTRVYDGQNVIVSQFDSKEDVIQALLCSCFIPFWTGLVAPKFKGVSYIDGGFSDNLLILDDKTITVSPFAGEYDICPRDNNSGLLQINISNTSMSVTPQNLYRLAHALLPSPPEVLSELCEQGFADGIKYLQRMNLISCTKCLEIRSSLLVSTNGEDMEEAFLEEVHHVEETDIPLSMPGAHMHYISSTGDHEEHHHIRLEQQEQKMIQIGSRRDSVVSTTSQMCQTKTTSTTTTTTTSTSREKLISTREGGRMSGTIYVEQQQSTFIVDDCDQCVQIRQQALLAPMPKLLTERIRHACDTVNKSLSNWIYSHRPIKYLSYMAAPYYLPVDISLSIIYRCFWRRLPMVKHELVNVVNGLVEFLISVLNKMDNDKSTSALLLESAGVWEADAIKYEKDLEKHRVKSLDEKVKQPQQNQNNNSNNNHDHNINCSWHQHSDKNTGDYSVKITNDGVCVCKLKSSRSSSNIQQLHSLEDTFDSIVDETSNQEARIFAYYFRDAKNRLQVTEIFDRERCSSQNDTLSVHSHHQQK